MIHKAWKITITLKNGKTQTMNCESKGHQSKQDLFDHLVNIDFKHRTDIKSIQIAEVDLDAVKATRPHGIEHILDEAAPAMTTESAIAQAAPEVAPPAIAMVDAPAPAVIP